MQERKTRPSLRLRFFSSGALLRGDGELIGGAGCRVDVGVHAQRRVDLLAGRERPGRVEFASSLDTPEELALYERFFSLQA